MALTELSRKKSTSFNSSTGTDYVYEITTFWDDQAQKKVTRRKVIGKIDPVTKQEVPTGPRGRPRHEVDQTIPEESALSSAKPDTEDKAAELSRHLADISREIGAITLQLQELQKAIDQLR